ncbi:DUF3102 domain-containing protein [Rhizobium phaseoli]|uniref:DUF3102 domain-containing protein n=1 Tax=Rhizobium phaseoli TaxID=396 RepID=UPI001F200BFA|nr:DUF3102 domain-containing protein [Rhizobium phaseoli]
MRPVNNFQMARIKNISDRENREIAFAAFGLGMTVKQFKALPEEQRRAAWDAHSRLCSPAALAAESRAKPDRPRLPRPFERVPEEKMIQIGRELIRIKDQLPHGHFGPWVREQSGLSYKQAQSFMRAATAAQQERSAA